MAKKTKDSNLSIEERLEQTLVPNWDYPYEIPRNWKFFWFTKLIDIEGGTQPPKSNFVEYELDGYIRLVQIRDFSCDKYIVYVPDSDKLRHFDERDILIARYGASLGKICTGLKGVYNVALAKTIFSEKVLNRKYVYWMLHSESFQNPLMAISRTAQAGFNKEDLSRFAMPLPPLQEQERIVKCVDALFAKLDEAKEKAQEVVDGFETRKAAILHKAFSGELTAKWRLEKQIDDNYSEKSIGELFTHTTGKALKKGNTTGLLRKYITTSNVYWGEFDFSEIREMYFTEKELDKCTARKGDLLICNGGDVGRAAIWEYDYEMCLQNHISKLRPKQNDVDVKFIYYYFMNSKMRGTINGKGIGISSLAAKDLLAMKVMLPTLAEQQKIVEILDSLVNNELKAKETAETVIEQIDTMKKAILARAFRGELGTNDPSEGSAVELLRKVLSGGEN